MSGLVGYESSDEEKDVEQRPAKFGWVSNASRRYHFYPTRPRLDKIPTNAYQATTTSTTNATPTTNTTSTALPGRPQPQGPIATADVTAPDQVATPGTPPLSPYTLNRQRLHNLTMPPVPNFSIPDSPPPPSSPDDVAALAATTKKFNRFLDLKRTGTAHFNARLQSTPSLRNPSLLPKLMEFAGISLEDSYRSTLSAEARGLPVRWPEECYVENLVKENERREKKRVKERERVEFVPAADTTSKSGGTSRNGTPKVGEGQKKKSGRFDKK
ncbi:hypothetical protein LTR37_004793 [Vermiconidia calcicola]|uniref:Uncharacterized protein n=1 Tax=Vermiconidia calcicola TaxID=1690605 RepID=A0ACC3NLH5_9PEZI|nr:hypothetical protein LTR37_004793 [Vermiconidia calcicola]